MCKLGHLECRSGLGRCRRPSVAFANVANIREGTLAVPKDTTEGAELASTAMHDRQSSEVAEV